MDFYLLIVRRNSKKQFINLENIYLVSDRISLYVETC